MADPKKDIVLEGIPASPGIVIGPCFLYQYRRMEPEPRRIPDKHIKKELRNFRQSIENARNYIQESYEKARLQYGGEIPRILEIQLEILNDRVFLDEIEQLIQTEKFNAAYATFLVFSSKKEQLLKVPDDYMRERALDVANLKWLVLENLMGGRQPIVLNKPAIVVADDLSPADTVNLHQQKVLGIATNKGGINSHTVIIARALSVPAVVGLERITDFVQPGHKLVLDGSHGTVIVNPSSKTVQKYQKRRNLFLSLEEALIKESTKESRTRDGRRIFILANIEFENEIKQVKKVGADGIGLFRTEGIYINRHILPSEEEQTQIYLKVAREMYPKPVTIRTIDIGGDKIFPHIFVGQEPNPFLGYRAIRFCLDHADCFISQLRAMLRANVKGNVQVMIPMVSSLEEVYQVKELFEKAKAELRQEGIPFGENTPLGIMVEIPSVVTMADEFAREVDFFSIGTNDLVQYTLAVDRSNEHVAYLYSHFHPAVLRLIKDAVDAARAANIPVSMCGEMAGDPVAVPVLIAMGLDTLSAAHVMIPEMKKVVRQLTVAECEAIYEEIRHLKTTKEIKRTLETFFSEKFKDVFFE
ncbi:MAG: phosphoenolpyruvate--protein phosphotransferase [Calditrichaeota bacterium]|nr:phosphoenolpyruvate--protein phosphotransferase [Calditrichota bacterium]